MAALAPLSSQLIDRFGRIHSYLRISLTDRCNLRCQYCMPESPVDWIDQPSLLTTDEIIRLATIFASLGCQKVRLTGGEPTVRKELETILGSLAKITDIKRILMTTNGLTLKQKAGTYRRLGLNGLNISLDTLRPDRYLAITRRDRFSEVMSGLDAALEAGYESVKLNCVVMRGINDDELLDFVEFAKSRPINVRFIEYMPFYQNGWSESTLFPYREMKAAIQGRYSLEPLTTEPSAVGKDFKVEGFAGSLSFVTSMTEDFCDSCNRVRLTAEGNLRTCLFWHRETPLREPLRDGATDHELTTLILGGMLKKPRGHAPLSTLPMIENRSMVQIGG